MKAFARNASGPRKQTIAVYICIAVSWAMCFGGIDTFCALFTLFPVMLTICAEANIPRKYLIGLITCGVSTAALTPGAPLVTNYTPMNILGTASAAGLIPGLAAVLVMLLGGGIYLCKSIHKASARGEVFEPGNVPFTPPEEGRKYPPFVVALIPLIAVVVVFNLINNLIPALALGFVLSLVLLVPFFPKTAECGRGKALINTLNEGGRSTAESIFMGAIVVGFASVVQATAAYQVMVDGLLSLPLPAPILVVIAVAILVGLTGSPTRRSGHRGACAGRQPEPVSHCDPSYRHHRRHHLRHVALPGRHPHHAQDGRPEAQGRLSPCHDVHRRVDAGRFRGRRDFVRHFPGAYLRYPALTLLRSPEKRPPPGGLFSSLPSAVRCG